MAEELKESIKIDEKLIAQNIEKELSEEIIPINDETLIEQKEPIETEQETIENEDKDEEDKILEDIKEEDFEELPLQKKRSKIYKILIIIIAILVTILTIGIVLYFMGFFDPKPIKKPVIKKEKKVKEIIFDEKRINKSKLNKKFKTLTKTELMTKDELEKNERELQEKKDKEKARIKALKEKREKEKEEIKEQYKQIKQKKDLLEKEKIVIEEKRQELLKLQEEAKKEIEKIKNEIKNSQNTSIDENMIKDEEVEKKDSKTFMSFINIATIKGELYKSYLDRILAIDKNVSLCRDFQNRIVIYLGPYDSKKERMKVFDNLLEKGFKESYLVDFTKEEYEKMCKY